MLYVSKERYVTRVGKYIKFTVMRRIYFENWLLTKLGFRLIDEEQGVRTYAKYDGEVCGYPISLMEVATSMRFIHITLKLDKKHWTFWKASWIRSEISKAEDVEAIFKVFFKENRKEINKYLKVAEKK